MTETERQPAKNPLSRVPRIKGECRQIVRNHEDAEGKVFARLVRVETGGVDRRTGGPVKVYFEVTAKVPDASEVTRTFAVERNAELAYLAATHGTVDLGTPLAELPAKLWRACRDRGAFKTLERVLPPELWAAGVRPLCWSTRPGLQPSHALVEHMAKLGLDDDGTRINSGDSDVDSSSVGVAATGVAPGGDRGFMSPAVAEVPA